MSKVSNDSKKSYKLRMISCFIILVGFFMIPFLLMPGMILCLGGFVMLGINTPAHAEDTDETNS